MPTYLTLASQGAAVRKALATSDGIVYLKPLIDEAADTDTARHGVIQTVFDALATAGGGAVDMKGVVASFNDTLELRTGNVQLLSQLNGPVLTYTGPAASIALDIQPENATTPATAALSGVRIGAIEIKTDATNSQATLIRARRINGLRMSSTRMSGGYHNLLLEGCTNTYWDNPACRAGNLSETAGSSGIRVTGLTLTDSSRFSGFTTVITGGSISSGPAKAWDASLVIEAADYFRVIGTYFGYAKVHTLITRTNANEKCVDVAFESHYWDGVAMDQDATCCIIDANSVATSLGTFGLFKFQNGKVGQALRGIVLRDADDSVTAFTGPVIVHNMGFNNVKETAISMRGSAGKSLDLSVTDCKFYNIGFGASSASLAYAAFVRLAKRAVFSGNVADGDTGGERGCQFVDVDNALAEGNSMTNFDPGRAIYTAGTNAKIKFDNNVGEHFIMPRDTYLDTSYTPALAFGGASVGMTYGAAREGVYRTIEGKVLFRAQVQLTAKGSSTGAATVTLPVTAAGSGGAWALDASIDGTTFAASVANGASVATITGADDTDFTATSIAIVTGVYTPA